MYLRLARLLQYASKFLSWALESRSSSLELAAKLKQLETSISTARKRTPSYPPMVSPYPPISPHTLLYLPTPSYISPYPPISPHTLLYLPTPSYISPHPPISPHTLLYLPTPSYISPYPPISPHTLLYLPTPSYISPHPPISPHTLLYLPTPSYISPYPPISPHTLLYLSIPHTCIIISLVQNLILFSLHTFDSPHPSLPVFRLGKSADHFRAALQTIHLTDVTLRVLITLNKLNRAFYLIIDNLLWAAKMNLVKVNVEWWTTWGMRFWLLAILLGLSRDMYELYVLTKTVQRTTVPSGEQPSLHHAAIEALRRNPPLALDLVKNSTDVFIPSAKLELMRVSGGVVGIMGVVSSLASLLPIWNDWWMLKYS